MQPFSEADAQADHNHITRFFASEVTKVVDKLHFKGHTGIYCKENCDPRKVSELQKVNTVICEQTFKWLNGFKSVKSMNEPNFFFFILYMIDLHNMSIEKTLRMMANPKAAARYNHINGLEFEEVNENTPGFIPQVPFNAKDALRSAATDNESEISKKENTDYEETSFGFTCCHCQAVYKQFGNLKKHMKNVHEVVLTISCNNCSTVFSDIK